ncbi:MAG: ACT domain-containing protein [archaeon YNP-LCB-003-016]|uniref:ACT domain-containing protein n=1 Tax=Candidatus Culexarchaeum yellowstonense TaxID=2928963 RepID=UPI0026EC152A|nr:ACT domain-containing protein [Candidatus Culexarchaeum yellowstonense]MCR6691036.1 ACT domain-containing protein [Candidatus Culexarchaeum yellowstonense]
MQRDNQPSIAEVTKSIILQHPSIIDCMKMDILNYSSLATLIKSEVENVLKGKKVREEAIKVALIRFSQEISEKWKLMEGRISWLLKKSTVELKSDIVVVTVKQALLVDKLGELMRIASKSRFFQLTQGTRTFTISCDKKVVDEVIKEIGGEKNVEKMIDDQSAIIIVSPMEVIEIPGFVSYVTTQLAWNGINITQIISCHEDTILIVDRKDAQKAYNIIEDMIIKHRTNITQEGQK